MEYSFDQRVCLNLSKNIFIGTYANGFIYQCYSWRVSVILVTSWWLEVGDIEVDDIFVIIISRNQHRCSLPYTPDKATLMLVTDIRTKCVDDNFGMLIAIKCKTTLQWFLRQNHCSPPLTKILFLNLLLADHEYFDQTNTQDLSISYHRFEIEHHLCAKLDHSEKYSYWSLKTEK